MALRRPELALIDLDGTMVDTVPDIAWCADEMLKRVGMAPYGEERIREWIGNGVERLVRRALTGTMEGEPEESLFARAYPEFITLYSEHHSARSRIYPGVWEGLEYLKSTTVKLGCVTNKAARFTEPLLRNLGLYDEFRLVVSGDTLPKKKPDPLPLLYAAEQLGAAPQNCLLVGDSISDVKAARAASYSVVCVSYGYNHGLDIRSAEPDAVIDSLAELDKLF